MTVFLMRCGSQSEAVKYVEKNLIGERLDFGMLLDLVCATQLQSTPICDQYVPLPLRLRGLRRSVTVRPIFRVTSTLDVGPASEDVGRTALTAVMTPCGENCGHPLTIVSL